MKAQIRLGVTGVGCKQSLAAQIVRAPMGQLRCPWLWEKNHSLTIKESDGIVSWSGEAWAQHLHSGNFEWTGFNGTVFQVKGDMFSNLTIRQFFRIVKSFCRRMLDR